MIKLILFLTCLFSIEEKIPDGPFCYPGKGPREIILLDQTVCPLLEQHYQDLTQSLDGTLSEKEILCLFGTFLV